ncbi:hypothetical protein GWI33_010617 [Rhynchophorus ferrugineus]|uniref:Uncharacterized protein n=1 Tax=Rhynchophorus ferrugineus TaxID=354439 RepID=A0A834IQG9_RHYFE|nr:hypothetical protein GWI33_010617 [Rhynchophorus ferrugineus]
MLSSLTYFAGKRRPPLSRSCSNYGTSPPKLDLDHLAEEGARYATRRLAIAASVAPKIAQAHRRPANAPDVAAHGIPGANVAPVVSYCASSRTASPSS